MEVAELTVRLEAQVAAFDSNLRSSQQILKAVQGDARGLERTVAEMGKVMKQAGLDDTKMRDAQILLKETQKAAKSLRDVFVEVGVAIQGSYVDASRAAESVAALDAETRAAKRLRDALAEAAAVNVFTNNPAFGGGYMTRNRQGFSGSYGGGPAALNQGQRALGAAPPNWNPYTGLPNWQSQLQAGQRALPPGAPNWMFSGDPQRQRQLEPGAPQLALPAAAGYNPNFHRVPRFIDRPLGAKEVEDSIREQENLQRDMDRASSVNRFVKAGRKNVVGAQEYLSRQMSPDDLAKLVGDEESRLRDVPGAGGGRAGGGGGGGGLTGGRRIGGGFFDRGNGGDNRSISDLYNGVRRGRGRYDVPGPNLFAGVLPGGSRARPAALASLALGIGSLGPAAVPAAAGLGVGAAAALPALLGTIGTLKLAFADMSKAAFTTKAAFDQLTPAQKALVLNLKSLDAGVLTPLEHIAQQALIPKLTTALQKAVSPQLVGAAQVGVGAFANGIGRGANDIASIIGSPQFAKNIQAIAVADAGYVRQFIDDIGRLAEAFVVLLKAAIPFTNWLSGLGVKLSMWVDQTTKAAAANGSLAKFLDKAKQGLQTIGGLLESVTKLFGAFGNAIGFKNSLGVFQLLTDLIQGLANFLNRNRAVFNDFLKGAIQSAHDFMSLLQPLIQHLGELLRVANSIAKAIGGWRVAIDIAIGAFLIKMVAGISKAKIFNQTLATTAETEKLVGASAITMSTGIGAATATQAANVGRLSGAVKGLQASILGFAGKIIPWVIALSIVPQNDSTSSILATLGIGIGAGFSAGGPLGAAVGAAAALTFEAGKVFQAETYLLGEEAPTKKQYSAFNKSVLKIAKNLPPALAHQLVAAAVKAEYDHPQYPLKAGADAVQAFVQAHQKEIDATNPATGGTPSTPFGRELTLPTQIQDQIRNADFSGNYNKMIKARASAYGYYKQLLKQPGLTKSQIRQIKDTGAQYAPSTPLQQTGGGATGFGDSTSAGGAVFNAQQAVGSAMVTGSGVSYSQQISLAKQYESAASSAYESLKKQKVAAADIAAKQAQLTVLLKDEAQARKDIVTIQHRQAVAQAKAVDDSRKAQISAHGTRIQTIRTNLAGRLVGATPTQQLQAINTALLGAGDQLQQLQALRKKLLAHDVQTSKLKAEENTIQKEINATSRLISTAQKDQLKALKTKQEDKLQEQISRTLGLGSVEPKGHIAAARSSSQLRSFLNDTLKKFGLGGTGSKPLEPFVKELYKAGDINKRQYTSLEKILTAIGLMKQDTGTISSGITGNISQRLKQIKDELAPTNNFSKLNFVTTEQAILKHNGGRFVGTAAQRAKFYEQSNERLGLHGKLHYGAGSVNGIPLNPDGSPAIKRPRLTLPTHMGGTYTLHVKVEADGSTPMSKAAAKAIADEVFKVFQASRRRNTTQMTGQNAGRNLGAGLG